MTFKELGINAISGSGWQRSTCPRCSHTRKKSQDKCLAYNIDEQAFICHHCGSSGKLSEPKFRKIEPKFKLSNPSEKMYAYFEKRGIKRETVDKFGIKYNSAKELIAFPFYYFDHIINIKYRSFDKKFHQEKDSDKICFNYNDLLDTEQIVIVEGEIAALTVSQAGFKVISMPEGGFKGKAGSKLNWYDKSYDQLDKIQRVILALDRDEVGQNTQNELARRIGAEKCYIARMPEDCKDMNEVLMKYGEQLVITGINDAEPYPLDGVFKVQDVWESFENIYYNGFPAGASIELVTDFQFFSKYLNVFTGIPSHGKTTYVYNILVQLSRQHQWKHLIFSPEHMMEVSYIKLARIYAGKYFKYDKGNINNIIELELNESRLFLNEYFQILRPNSSNTSLDYILSQTENVVKQRGINSITIDPWNTIEHIWDSNTNETNYISFALQQLKDFAHKYDVMINLIAHPTKMNYQGKISKPSLYDIAGSAHFYNKMDNGFIVHRNNDSTEVEIAKVKEDHIGETGNRNYTFDKKSLQFIKSEKLSKLSKNEDDEI